MPHTTRRGRIAMGLCAFLFVTIGLFAVRAASARAQEAQLAQPNLFDLRGFGVSVNYAASSLDGRPRLTYNSFGTTQNFAGDQITATESPLGTLVTVQIAATPDLSTTTFTLVIPRINVEFGQSVNVRTQGITTTERTSIGGPALVRGQLQSYRVTALSGTARQVMF
jgi:hypothetical protein